LPAAIPKMEASSKYKADASRLPFLFHSLCKASFARSWK